jgi:bifunctional DNA-binding transcriptional regulator/antitoxin component of YhaV-PrlF toxin-antitoxin module
MSNQTYSLKVSPQGQLTLPRELRARLRVNSGSRITARVAKDGSLQLSNKLPITKHFGSLPGVWTAKGQDAAEYTRKLRDSMQPKLHP